VTEIPEHLLKRSRERRSAIGKGDDAGASDETTPSTPATTASTAPATTAAAAAPAATGPAPRTAAPAPAAPPPPKPDPVYVEAAKKRKKIPFWAMATLSLMPVWAFMYVRAVTEPPEVVEGPLGMGAEVYGNCASCHGAAGGGGVGYPFEGQSVLQTFPHIEDQLRYVYFGTAEYNLAGVEIYGNPEREGGPHVTGAFGVMPGWSGSLTDEEILSVVCHERYTLGGADPAGDYADEYETWCSESSPVFADLEAGGALADIDQRVEGIIPIGDAPVAGSPAAE
jgi:mono/diheme cytochrome c family protein